MLKEHAAPKRGGKKIADNNSATSTMLQLRITWKQKVEDGQQVPALNCLHKQTKD